MKASYLLLHIAAFIFIPSYLLAIGDNILPGESPVGGVPECGPVQGGSGARCEAWMPPLLVAGDDNVDVSDQYSATGGVLPYGWAISCGGIDSTGIITSLSGCCNSATVTVKDECLSIASKSVNVPVPPVLTLAGTETPSLGSQYSASGGTPPYAWSISCGQISSAGAVTSLSGCCGSGDVTVTDGCRRQERKAVRFPAGQWVRDEQKDYTAPAADLNSCGGCNEHSGYYIDCVAQDYWYRYYWARGCIGNAWDISHWEAWDGASQLNRRYRRPDGQCATLGTVMYVGTGEMYSSGWNFTGNTVYWGYMYNGLQRGAVFGTIGLGSCACEMNDQGPVCPGGVCTYGSSDDGSYPYAQVTNCVSCASELFGGSCACTGSVYESYTPKGHLYWKRAYKWACQ